MGSTVLQSKPARPIDPGGRSRRHAPAALVVPVVIALIAGTTLSCAGRTVAGHAVPVEPGTTPVSSPLGHVGTSLGRLLPDRLLFGPAYDTRVLSPSAAADAAGDLTGVAAHSTVVPAHCRPPAQRFDPDDTEIEVGTDNTTRSTVTVELTRVTRPLTERRDQLMRCSTMTVTNYGAEATVRSRLQPPPSVHADDVIAVDQTVQSGGAAGSVVRQSMTTLMAQVGDVRIAAISMTFGADPGNSIGGRPDNSSIPAALLANAVAKAHAG